VAGGCFWVGTSILFTFRCGIACSVIAQLHITPVYKRGLKTQHQIPIRKQGKDGNNNYNQCQR
jgi:hypothetical protein